MNRHFRSEAPHASEIRQRLRALDANKPRRSAVRDELGLLLAIVVLLGLLLLLAIVARWSLVG